MGTFEVVLTAYCIMVCLQAYGSQRVECGSVNAVGSHNLTGSSTIRRYGLVGGIVSLWGWALRSPLLKLHPVRLTTSYCLHIKI